VVHHKNFSYLNDWLGLQEVGQLEPRPGLPPTAAHLGDLLARLAKDPAKAVLRAPYNDPQASEWLSSRAKMPAVMLPFTVGGSDTARDLFGLHIPPAKPHPSYARLSRYDETGLCWLLDGREVVALTEATAAIQNPTGAITIYRRHDKPALGPVGDSLDDFK